MPGLFRVLRPLLAAGLLLLLSACGGSGSERSAGGPLIDGRAAFPKQLPADGVQPWESANATGNVVPPMRQGSSLNKDSESASGNERFAEGGMVSDLGAASQLSSGSKGSGDLSYALYRLPMAGKQPGALEVDVNLRPRSAGAAGESSSYYVGLSDYAAGSWDWHGPFNEAQLRLGRAPAASAGQAGLLTSSNYLSPLGNLFVAVVAFDGADFDIVDLGANPKVNADSTAPPAPAALAASSRKGCLQLDWTAVVAADLAGYRLYYSNNSFSSTSAAGVTALPFLQGSTNCLLPALNLKHVRVSAVDISGNESPLSTEASAAPATGAIPSLSVSTSIASGKRNAAVTLSVTAAAGSLFDYDLNGDGDYEITGSAALSQSIDTSGAGIIRPAVRAVWAGGNAIALGSVSLLISGNSRPVALATATPSSGATPLLVSFGGAGEDSDGTIAQYAWDFDGDGIFDYTSAASAVKTFTYNTVGVHNAKLRVTDDQGDWDVDSVVIITDGVNVLLPQASFSASPPECNLGDSVFLNAAASTAGTGTITKYEWDLNSDGTYEINTGAVPSVTKTFSKVGYKSIGLRITNSVNATATASLNLTVHGWSVPLEVSPTGAEAGSCSLKQINGRPAIAYFEIGGVTGAYYIRASDAYGAAWGSPEPVDIAGNCNYPDLELVAGRPALCFYDSVFALLKYARGTDPDGSNFGTVAYPDLTTNRGAYCSLAVINGKPAISYQELSQKDLLYVYAADAAGVSWNPSTIVDSTNDTGEYTSLAEVSGAPAIAYHNATDMQLRFIRASDATGSAWGNAAKILDGSNPYDCGQYANLIVIQGVPCIAYKGSHTSAQGIYFARALSSDGEAWQVPLPIEESVSMAFPGEYTDLAVVNGIPAIACQRPILAYVGYATATNAAGTNWTPPQAFLPVNPTTGMSIYEINGNAAIAYNDVNANKLMYMRLY